MTKILVVDDEADVIELMRDWLELRKYEVLSAADGYEALRIAEGQQPDLVLLDVMMPGIDGIETCRRLRGGDKTSHIPVILVTARGPTEGRAEGLMAGAVDYVTKPVALDDLGARIQAALAPNGAAPGQSERLLQETVHAALTILPCQLAWLLTLDPQRQALIGRAVATEKGDQAATRFLQTAAAGQAEVRIDLDGAKHPLATVATSGAAELNMPLSQFRTEGGGGVYTACEDLDLYFVSILPLQTGGVIQGILLVGTRDQGDIETTRGRQLLAAVVSQAATVVNNARLMGDLAEREAESSRERTFRQMLLDTMGDGLLVHDSKGLIRFVNRRLSRMTGYEIETFQGRPVGDLFQPEDHERVQGIVSGAHLVKTSSFELHLRRADDTVIPVLVVQASSPVSRASGDDGEHVVVITDLTEQKARETALTKQSQRLAALTKASQTIGSTLALDEVIQTILREASEVLDATAASVQLRVPNTDTLVFHSAVGPGAEKLRGLQIPLDKGVAGYVARKGQPALVADALSDPRFYREVDLRTGVVTRSIAAVPLTMQGETIGVVEVINKRHDAFDKADLDILQNMARSAAIAIENARLFEKAERRVRELTLLLEVSEAAASTLAPEEMLERVAKQVTEALDTQWCVIARRGEHPDELLTLAEVASLSWEIQQGRRLSLSDYLSVQKVLSEGKPLSFGIDDPELDTRLKDDLLATGTRTFLILPIVIDGLMAGLAKVYSVETDRFYSPTDLERCRQAMIAWRNTLSAQQSWTGPNNTRDLATRLLHATDSDWCSIMAYQHTEKELTIVHEQGSIIWPLGQGLVHHLDEASLRRVAMVEGTPVTADLGDPTLSDGDRVALQRSLTGTILIVPLLARGKAVGLLYLVDTNSKRHFTNSELSLAQAIANAVGNALENVRLYASLERRAAQLEAAYNDLKEADRTKDELIQNVSHELRTPLTSIIGYVDLMLAGDFGEVTDEQRDGLTVIGNKSRHLSRLVEDILSVQRMESYPLRRELVTLQEIADSVITTFHPSATQTGLEIVKMYNDSLPQVYVDKARIAEVFDNLLSNAIKFSPNGGEIVISIHDTGPALQAEVRDPGIGIPEEEHEKIWRRFYQVDGSTTRQYGGTGLGLTIVKQIIEAHEGRIWVESETGKGSIFGFIIPKTEITGTGELKGAKS